MRMACAPPAAFQHPMTLFVKAFNGSHSFTLPCAPFLLPSTMAGWLHALHAVVREGVQQGALLLPASICSYDLQPNPGTSASGCSIGLLPGLCAVSHGACSAPHVTMTPCSVL